MKLNEYERVRKVGKKMKAMKNLLVMVAAIALSMTMMVSVKADQTTDLSAMKVYALAQDGIKHEVKFDFSSTTYDYNLTIPYDVVEIQIEATPSDSTSTYKIDKDGINTKMDTGVNKTQVIVTSASNATATYTLNTTKLTEADSANFSYDDESSEAPVKTTSGKEVTVKIGKKKYKISESINSSDIPEGFKKDSAKYKGKKHACIRGEVKDIVAFYLVGDKEGFYIYDEDQNLFYPMNNIKIKSRMYTIVKPEKEDGILTNYDVKKITIIDQKVDAWVLDADENMYLVYAMNWNGEANLYTYDDNEKCFQRYLVSADANQQTKAAAKAYNNLEKDYNNLVRKYNIFVKILCGLAIFIVVLIFIIFNLALNKKEKKIKGEEEKPEEKIEEKQEEPEKVEELSKKEKKAAKKMAKAAEKAAKEAEKEAEKAAKKAEKAAKKAAKNEVTEDDIDGGVAIGDEEAVEEIVEEPSEETAEEPVNEVVEEKEEVKDEVVTEDDLSEELKVSIGEMFKDEPKDEPEESSEEDDLIDALEDAKDDVFIDIVDNADDDLEKTIKDLLPDENFDDDDDDDDFEFIDLD